MYCRMDDEDDGMAIYDHDVQRLVIVTQVNLYPLEASFFCFVL